MIKITVHPEGDPKTYQFSQANIVIGEGLPGAVDICFPSEGLHQNHVRIVLKENGYQILNQANDPFVTLNGQPFGKKMLQRGDLLQIRNHTLRIDSIDEAVQTENLPAIIAEPFPDIEALANEDNPEAWYPPDFSPTEPPIQSPASVSPVRESSKPHPVDPRVEEAYQLGEETFIGKREPKKAQAETPPKKRRWKMKLLKLTIAAFCIFCVGLSLMLAEIYLRASSKSETEEMTAAESLADYAMALTYAKIYQASMQKQNWLDPLFIKNNLIDLLSSTSAASGEIDAQGNFCSCPYFLRFYTSRDFSRFLLIAQPTPNLAQWLFPKSAIIVDSDQMILRKVEDFRALNRQLSQASPLEGEAGADLSKTLQQFKIITPKEIAQATDKKEFAPPPALKFFSPGAETYIYNAPRYHHLTGTFLKKAKNIISQPYGTHVAALLQSDKEALIKLPQIVFYTDSTMQGSEKMRSILRKLSVPSPFLTAHLVYNSKGHLESSRLLFDSAHESSSQESDLAEQPFFKPKPHFKQIDEEDPKTKFIRIQAEEARKSLVPILQSLQTLLNDASERDSLYLSPLFYTLMDQYDAEKKKIAEILSKQLAENEHDERILREMGLWDLYQAYLNDQAKQNSISLKEKWDAWHRLRSLNVKKNGILR